MIQNLKIKKQKGGPRKYLEGIVTEKIDVNVT